MSKCLLIDDEPHNVTWLIDYLESIGFEVRRATSLDQALTCIEDGSDYRFLIVDLSIPYSDLLSSSLRKKGAVYIEYPGLYFASAARTKGFRTRQVIVHTVHRDQKITAEAEKLGITYILKGRPRSMKTEIQEVISFDPTL